MRKALISVLMISLLLLGGCGEREARLQNDFAAFRDALIAAGGVGFRAELTADYGETVSTYLLAVSYDGQETAVEIMEPALLSGVRAVAKWGEAAMEYDGVMLGAGPLDEDGLTPVSALPAILSAMAGGHEELLWWDGDTAAARLYVGESSACTVWLDKGLVPVRAELSSGGRTVISCAITDWTIT